MPKHTSIERVLTVLTVTSILLMFLVQAKIALEPEYRPTFSLEKMNIVFGYGSSASSASSTAICGNSLRTGAETCDDGNTTAGDGCSATCSVESGYTCNTATPNVCSQVCGNGIKTVSEGCDDGDTSSGDGCSASCAVESGYSCTGTAPSVCTEVCGNGIITSGETCDDGNTSNGDGCTSVCSVESGYECTGAPSTCVTDCGDGIEAGAEQCDDGNSDNDDACLNSCIDASCGDGYIQGDETCDGDGLGTGGETSTCDVDCTAVTCGDQRVNETAGEACDDGNSATTDSCIACIAASCGDNFLRSGIEQCEPPGAGTCNLSCQSVRGVGATVTSAPEPVTRQGPPSTCGNGVVDTAKGEKCDAGRFNGLSAACDRWCGITFCGDQKVHADSEECEPEQDENGSYVVRTCGGKSCTVPVCGQDGSCIGGCRWVFLPACRNVELTSGEPEPVVEQVSSSSQSSEAVMTPVEASSSSEAIVLPVDTGVTPLPVVTSSAASIRYFSSASSALPVLVTLNESSSSLRSERSSSSSSSAASSVARVPFCGDAQVEGSEECDDGNANTDAAPNSCRTSCVFAFCGDRVTDAGEECDDGNDILGDGCTQLCTRSTCGNGVLEHGEECDEGKNNNDTLPDSCSTQCLMPHCGDAIVDAAFGESCDDGELNSNQPDSCRFDCIAPRCGDGIKDSGEECDDGNSSNTDACSTSCRSPVCGNAVMEWGEACDDGNQKNADGCSSICAQENDTFLSWFQRALRLPFRR